MKKQFFVVTIPVGNLRKEPVDASSGYLCDELQETQVLCNEVLLHREEREGWCYVEATEQKKKTCQGDWQGYPGWIRKTAIMPIKSLPVFNAVVKQAGAALKKDRFDRAESFLTLSMGTQLTIIKRETAGYYETTLADGQNGWIRKDDINIMPAVTDPVSLRKDIVKTARQLIGTPYLWGGRSACVADRESKTEGGRQKREDRTNTRNEKSIVSGVDCSGLINLAYRVNMLDLPRDACDQWRASVPVEYDVLAPADPIFVSAEGAYDLITHVVMHVSGDQFIEASESGGVVTANTFRNKWGLTLREAAGQGFVVNRRRLYFGSVFAGGRGK